MSDFNMFYSSLYGHYFTTGGPVDYNGNPVEKTKHDYPYTYDSFVTYRNGSNEEVNHTVYPDRLISWGRKKYDKLAEKYFGGSGHYFSGRSPESIERFLQEYYENPKLKLIVIQEGCNVSNGYPYWVFHFNSNN